MSRDHRPPIRNPFLPPTPEEPEVPARDGGHPTGDGGAAGAPAASTAREDRLPEFRLGPAFLPHPADPAAPGPGAPSSCLGSMVSASGRSGRGPRAGTRPAG